MPPSIPKVQQKAIEQITSGSLSSTDYRYLMHEAAEKGWAHVVQVAIERGEDRTKLLQTMLPNTRRLVRVWEKVLHFRRSTTRTPNSVVSTSPVGSGTGTACSDPPAVRTCPRISAVR